MRLLVLHGVADGFVVCLMENYRKSFIRNNRVKKISSEPDAVIRRATSGSRGIGSRSLAYNVISAITFFMQSPRNDVIGKFCSYLAY